MTVYDKPIVYLLVHVGLGVLAAWNIWILWLMLAYQILQLIVNKRFFLIEMEIRDGNHWKHTTIKLLEFFIGFTFGFTYKIIMNKHYT